MEQRNNIISGLQFAIMSFFLTGSIFVGIGITSMFSLAGRDIWITVLVGTALSIIPALMFIYIFNYQPDKNIFEKNKILFGKSIGSGINLILCGLVYFQMMLVIWSITNLIITMYLTKTPEYFISGIFLLLACYAVIKGIETIGRMSEIVFYINMLFYFITIISLLTQFNHELFKPILEYGFMPAITPVINFLSYLFSPIIVMTVIPKNSIQIPKYSSKFIIGSFMLSSIIMAIIFIITAGVITPELAEFYLLPAYYVERKVSIGGFLNNLENILSLHWFNNILMLIILGIYFISKGIDSFINIKSFKIRNIIILVIGLSLIFTRNVIFHNTVMILKFVKYQLPLLITLPILTIVLLIIIAIYFKKKITT